MRTSGKCPKCGSTNLLAAVHVFDYGGGGRRNLEVAVETDPNAWWFLSKGERRGQLAAWICIQCGFTELYCMDLVEPLSAGTDTPSEP
jgi:predicted nucleic-acid-binding Zn-ribbon protein